MSMSCELWLKYKDYLLYNEDGEELGLQEDAPKEAKEAYEQEEKIHNTFDEKGCKIRF